MEIVIQYKDGSSWKAVSDDFNFKPLKNGLYVINAEKTKRFIPYKKLADICVSGFLPERKVGDK